MEKVFGYLPGVLQISEVSSGMIMTLVSLVALASTLVSVLSYNTGSAWRGGILYVSNSSGDNIELIGESRLTNNGQTDDEIDIKRPSLVNVSNTFSTADAYAALLRNGTVRVWGKPSYGGCSIDDGDNGVADRYTCMPSGLGAVETIHTTFAAFIALLKDGTVVSWGSSRHGGPSQYSVFGQNHRFAPVGSITSIQTSLSAFVAINSTGYISVAGTAASSSTVSYYFFCVPESYGGNIVKVYSTMDAFAALSDVGRLFAFGYAINGGCFPTYKEGHTGFEAWQQMKWFTCLPDNVANVVTVFSNTRAFVALFTNNTAFAWGAKISGGCNYISPDDNSPILLGTTSYASCMPYMLGNISTIYSNENAFVALQQDGGIVAWGRLNSGGCVGNSNDTQYSCAPEIAGVKEVFATSTAFAALQVDGSVSVWGDHVSGGCQGLSSPYCMPPDEVYDVVSIASTDYAFLALRRDGRVVAWGSIFSIFPYPSQPAEVSFSQLNSFENVASIYTASSKNPDIAPYYYAKQSINTYPALKKETVSVAILFRNGSIALLNSTKRVDNVERVTGSTVYYSDSNSEYYPCPYKYYGIGYPNCAKCPTPLAQLSPFASGLQSSIGSCISCQNSDFSLDGLTCSDACAEGYVYRPPTFFGTQSSTCVSNGCSHGMYYNQTSKTCNLCPKGHAGLDGVCSVCPVGKYAPNNGQSYCTYCPGHSTTISTGATSVEYCYSSCGAGQYGKFNNGGCADCQIGQFSNSSNAFQCSNCSTGEISSSGSAYCSACEAGKYSALPDRCLFCDQGSFSTVGQSACSKCIAGKFSNTTGSSFCYSCIPGKFSASPGETFCEKCSSGKYTDQAGMAACLPCPSGSTSIDGVSNCTLCPAGKYKTGTGFGECIDCAIGKFSQLPGSISCARCASGFGTNGTGFSSCVNSGLIGDCRGGERKNPITSFCEYCVPGRYSIVGNLTECLPCKAGTYAPSNGSEACLGCPAGRFRIGVGGKSIGDCTVCQPGTFNPNSGSSVCTQCPPGSFCPDAGMHSGIVCTPGTVTDSKGRSNCTSCGTGRYQPNEGEAVCRACEKGKYGATAGGIDEKVCVDCPIGKFSASAGSDACSLCGKSEITEQTGQSSCLECTVLGEIANPDRSACIPDPNYDALLGPSLLETMYTKGAALYGTAIVLVLFLLISGILQYKKEAANKQNGTDLAMLPRYMVALKSGVTGFSFGSELLLLIGLVIEAPSIAYTMIGFRLCHVVVMGLFLSVIFGSNKHIDRVQASGIVSNAEFLKNQLNAKFCQENVPFVAAMILLCLCDCSLVQLLPWKHSKLYTESKGFPSVVLLRWALGTDCVQGVASAICQMYYLVKNAGINDATTTTQAKILFISNISIALVGTISSLIMLLMKEGLMNMNGSEKNSVPEDNGSSSDSFNSLRDVRISRVGMDALYPESDNEGGAHRHTTNPMMAGGEEMRHTTNPMMAGEEISQLDIVPPANPHGHNHRSVGSTNSSNSILQATNDMLRNECLAKDEEIKLLREKIASLEALPDGDTEVSLSSHEDKVANSSGIEETL